VVYSLDPATRVCLPTGRPTIGSSVSARITLAPNIGNRRHPTSWPQLPKMWPSTRDAGIGWSTLVLYRHDWKLSVPLKHFRCPHSQLFRASRSHWQDVLCDDLVRTPSTSTTTTPLQHLQQHRHPALRRVLAMRPTAVKRSNFVKWHCKNWRTGLGAVCGGRLACRALKTMY